MTARILVNYVLIINANVVLIIDGIQLNRNVNISSAINISIVKNLMRTEFAIFLKILVFVNMDSDRI